MINSEAILTQLQISKENLLNEVSLLLGKQQLAEYRGDVLKSANYGRLKQVAQMEGNGIREIVAKTFPHSRIPAFLVA